MIEIRILGESELLCAHQLSVEIFGESMRAEKYSIERWADHLSKNSLLLGAFKDGELIGFKFGYEREPGRFHSWLGGVRSMFRRQGAMRALTHAQESWARSHGFYAITVNTFQDKFPQMYQFLLGEGYQIIKVSGSEQEKTHFQKIL